MAKLDDTDRQLLMLLQEDDRQPLAALSEKIGVAVSTINDRIKRLIRSGVISGFHARVAPEAVGLDLLAFIMVSWSNPKIEADIPGKGEGIAGRAGVPSHHRRLELSAEGSRRHHARSRTIPQRNSQGGGRRGANRNADHAVVDEGDMEGQSRGGSIVTMQATPHAAEATGP